MRCFLFFCTLAVCIGCNSSRPSYTTLIKSISANKIVLNKTFRIRSVNGELPNRTLRQTERLKTITRVLFDNGFIESKKDVPKFDIDIIFGVSNPRTKIDSSPIIGKTGVSSSTTYGNISSDGSFSSTSYNNPSYGVVGSKTYSYDEYTRYLIIKGYDTSGREVFDSQAFSTGTSNDLDRVLPILVFSMTPYFAKDVPTSVAVPLELENRIYMKWLRNKSFVSERFTPALTDKLFQLFSEGKISKKAVREIKEAINSNDFFEKEFAPPVRRKLWKLYNAGEISKDVLSGLIKIVDKK